MTLSAFCNRSFQSKPRRSRTCARPAGFDYGTFARTNSDGSTNYIAVEHARWRKLQQGNIAYAFRMWTVEDGESELSRYTTINRAPDALAASVFDLVDELGFELIDVDAESFAHFIDAGAGAYDYAEHDEFHRTPAPVRFFGV